MAATRINNPYVQYLDDTGNVLASGTLTVYENGTTTLASIYSDAALTVPQSNPYTLNSLGQVAGDIFINETVTLLLKDSSGATIWQLDDVNVEADADALINLLAAKGCAFTYADVVSAGYTITAGDVVRGSNGNTYKYNSGSVVDPVTDTPYDEDSGLSNSGAWTDIVIANSTLTPGDLSTIESDVSTLQTDVTSLEGQITSPDYVSGLAISNNATSSKLDIAAGTAMESANTVRMTLSSAITKTTGNWTEGDDNGGFPSLLTIATSTWYRVFLIAKTDGTTDVGFDSIGNTNATALLNDATDYLYYRQIGWIFTDSGTATNIKPFKKVGSRYYWESITEERAAAAATSGSETITISEVPPGCEGELCVYGSANTNSSYVEHLRFYPTDFTVSSVDTYSADLTIRRVLNNTQGTNSSIVVVPIDSSNECNVYSDGVGISYSVGTRAYFYTP